MDRLTRHQTQLQYTRREEEQSTEIQRGWGRLFDGQDAADSMNGVSHLRHQAGVSTLSCDWSIEQENVLRAYRSPHRSLVSFGGRYCKPRVKVMPPPRGKPPHLLSPQN